MDDVRVKMKTLLEKFLPDSLIEQYMKSRFFTIDFLDENLYSKL